jgi:hypothetical protein
MNQSKNSERSSKRGWSIIRKAQIIAGTTAAFVTIIMLGLEFGLTSPANNPVLYYLFGFFMLSIIPPVKICSALGISQGPAWWGATLAIMINTFLGVTFGTLAGWIIKAVKKIKT